MKQTKYITVTVNGNKITAKAPILLSTLTGEELPCGGHGSCGKCRVLAQGNLSEISPTERRLLSPAELAQGIRLACLTYATGDCEIESLQGKKKEKILTRGSFSTAKIQPVFQKYGVAIDLGTTTVASRLYDTEGKLLAEDARHNPQSNRGADVVSRMEAALGGAKDALRDAICNALNESISELSKIARISAKDIDGGVITGNTVMLSLLTGESVEPLSHAPFSASRLFGETVTADALNLHTLSKNTPIDLPPCISAFVGADTVCAILATDLCEKDAAMLVDIGTNGEMALWQGGRLTVCSTAAGPALEGVGISSGMQAQAGAIDRVSIVNGAFFAHVIEKTAPRGICGSGLIDAVACMLDLELLDENGSLEEDPCVIQSPVLLTQADIRALQLAKSAIRAGLETLIDNQNLKPSDISVLFVAGGLGASFHPRNASRIGLLPHGMTEKIRAVGNAALSGASLLLLNTDAGQRARDLASCAVTISLANSPIFQKNYLRGMIFS